MTIPKDTNYPPNLTNKYWQSKKSFKDKTKSATKTGLGDMLLAAEKAWKAIPFDKLDASQHDPKTVQEAEDLLAESKRIRVTEVPAAVRALDKAWRKAEATSGNAALSDTARATAKSMAQGLFDAKTKTLAPSAISSEDFELALAHVEARVQGGSALLNLSVEQANGAQLGQAPKAVRSGDTVTIANFTWRTTTSTPADWFNKVVTVHARHPDDKTFQNDMLVTVISPDTKTITLKNAH